MASWFGLPYNFPCNNLQTEHASQAPHWRKQVELQRLGDNIFAPKKGNPSTTDPTPQKFPSDEKGDNDNFSLHLWELWMPHLQYLFHCGSQKGDNISAIKMLHQMPVWVVVAALGLVLSLDGPAIRNANRGDSRESIRANRFAGMKSPILKFITCERFARIASNLRFAMFSPPKRDSQKKGSVREP